MIPQGRHQTDEATTSPGILLTIGKKLVPKQVTVVVKLVLVKWFLVLILGEESCQVDTTWNSVIQAVAVVSSYTSKRGLVMDEYTPALNSLIYVGNSIAHSQGEWGRFPGIAADFLK